MQHSSYNILIVEPITEDAVLIESTLKALGHHIIGMVHRIEEAQVIAKQKRIDFLFINTNIKAKRDGITYATEINRHKKIAIIYIADSNNHLTMELACETNIYGYLIKPLYQNAIESTLAVAISRAFGAKEIKNVHQQLTHIKLGDHYCFNLKTKTLLHQDTPIYLTKKETELLNCFSRYRNQYLSYDQIMQEVWYDKPIALSTIRDTVSKLRKKVPPLVLESIVGIGYCLHIT